jgi:hypothetical protein
MHFPKHIHTLREDSSSEELTLFLDQVHFLTIILEHKEVKMCIIPPLLRMSL